MASAGCEITSREGESSTKKRMENRRLFEVETLMREQSGTQPKNSIEKRKQRHQQAAQATTQGKKTGKDRAMSERSACQKKTKSLARDPRQTPVLGEGERQEGPPSCSPAA